jgi:hypothetical protein
MALVRGLSKAVTYPINIARQQQKLIVASARLSVGDGGNHSAFIVQLNLATGKRLILRQSITGAKPTFFATENDRCAAMNFKSRGTA